MVLAIVWGLLCLVGWRALPDENEPHYVGKLYHYWHPDWCAGDVFLESADAHSFFFWISGWPTLWLDLPTFTALGRTALYGCLAVAWVRLWIAVRLPLMTAPPAMLGFVAATRYGHLAGEWVVGGFEAKVLAYALVWLGLAAWLERRWQAACGWLGLATLVHVIVGGWWTLGIVITSGADGPGRAILRRPWGLGLLGLCAAMAVISAGQLDAGADPLTRAQAHRIYVYERLPHHLVPWGIAWSRVAAHATLGVIWLTLRGGLQQSAALRQIDRLTWFGLLLALGGEFLGGVAHLTPDIGASLLRFYWFRVTDVMLPLSATIAVTASLIASTQRETWRRRGAAAVAVGGLVLAAVDASQQWANDLPAAAGLTNSEKWSDWQEACHWIKENTPSEMTFVTPRFAQSFKWYAERPEFANWKDIPQDAPTILGWWGRLGALHAPTERLRPYPSGWYRALTDVPVEQLQRLVPPETHYGLITKAFPQLDLPLLHQNNSYAVYRLDPQESEQPDDPR
jgi:hypothetical protein